MRSKADISHHTEPKNIKSGKRKPKNRCSEITVMVRKSVAAVSKKKEKAASDTSGVKE